MRAITDAGVNQQLSSATEVLLLDGIRRGDDRCFEEVFRRYRDTVFGVLFRLVGDREEAEDLTQEVFVQLYRHPMASGREHNIGGWLYRVAMNTGYNAIRSRKRDAGRLERAMVLDRDSVIPDESRDEPAEQAIIEEERIRVRSVLMEMSERGRNCLILRQSGLSYAEVSQTLSIALNSVGTTLARAEREFRDKYTAKYDSERSGR
jgi:RNA polymerase sigma-70 factor, ECF subfamily